MYANAAHADDAIRLLRWNARVEKDNIAWCEKKIKRLKKKLKKQKKINKRLRKKLNDR